MMDSSLISSMHWQPRLCIAKKKETASKRARRTDDEAEKSFVIGGKEITAKLLSEALHSLSAEKRETVLLYYFFDMSEREIATYCNIPRTTVQTRRTSSMKLLKRYLEEHAYDYKG